MAIRGKKKWFSFALALFIDRVSTSSDHRTTKAAATNPRDRVLSVCVRALICLFVCWVSIHSWWSSIMRLFSIHLRKKIVYSNWMYYVTHSLPFIRFLLRIISVASGSFGCALSCSALMCAFHACMCAFHLLLCSIRSRLFGGLRDALMRLSQECATQTKMNTDMHSTITTHSLTHRLIKWCDDLLKMLVLKIHCARIHSRVAFIAHSLTQPFHSSHKSVFYVSVCVCPPLNNIQFRVNNHTVVH